MLRRYAPRKDEGGCLIAGLTHSVALFITLLPILGFATLVFLALALLINVMRGHDTFGNYLRRRGESGKLLSGVFGINLLLTGLTLPGTGVGIYLSLVIIPSVIHALIAVGVSSPLAIFAGIFLAFDLVALSAMFFMAPTWLAWRWVALPGTDDIFENPMQILPFLGMFAGLGLGLYLTTLLYPILMTALTALALPHATVVLAALIIVFEVVFATSFLVFGATTGLANLFGWSSKPAGHREDFSLDYIAPSNTFAPGSALNPFARSEQFEGSYGPFTDNSDYSDDEQPGAPATLGGVPAFTGHPFSLRGD